MKNSDYILVNGCSFTYGIGLSKEHGSEEMLSNRYSSLLCEKLGMRDVNISAPGSCNMRIQRTTIDHITTGSPNLIICMWSDPPRTEIFRPQESEYQWLDMAQINPQSIGKIQSREHKLAFEMYYTFIHSTERGVLHTLDNMQAVTALCDAYSIPLINIHYKDNFKRKFEECVGYSDAPSSYIETIQNKLDYVVENSYYIDKSFLGLIEEEDLDFGEWSGGHPGFKSHERMADYLYGFIDNVIG